MTHICVGNLPIIGSDNGLLPDRRQALIWTNAGILLIGRLGTNFSEILIKIITFSFKKIRLKMSSAKSCSFRLGLNELMNVVQLQSMHSTLRINATFFIQSVPYTFSFFCNKMRVRAVHYAQLGYVDCTWYLLCIDILIFSLSNCSCGWGLCYTVVVNSLWSSGRYGIM